jgi:transposase-like protein
MSMNTATANSATLPNPVLPAAIAAKVVAQTVPDDPANELDPITAIHREIDALKERLAIEQAKAIDPDSIQARVASIPAILKVSTIHEAIDVLRRAIAPLGRMPRIGADILGQMREALSRGATLSAVAHNFGVSEATVSNYKARWGLTHRSASLRSTNIIAAVTARAVKEATQRRGKRYVKKGYVQLPVTSREGIVRALIEGEQTVRQIAKAFGTSRQTVYSIRGRLDEHQKAA